jgi:hypothetical protein
MEDTVELTPKTLCISNIPQMMGNFQHNIGIINEPLLQTFRESYFGQA